MVWLAVVLFILIEVAAPWWVGTLDVSDHDVWLPLAGHLGITLLLAVVVWRWFENDGMVLIAVLLWLLSGPMWRGVSAFMVAANAPPASAVAHAKVGP